MNNKQSQPKKGSKRYILLEYLRANTSVTAMGIIDVVSTTAPHRLLQDLRHKYGLQIDCDLVFNSDGSRYGVFTLVSGGIKNDYS